MVQEYLPAVRDGDKRVLLLAGEILGAINSLDRTRATTYGFSNIHAGRAWWNLAT